jgi:hypothetical protein
MFSIRVANAAATNIPRDPLLSDETIPVALSESGLRFSSLEVDYLSPAMTRSLCAFLPRRGPRHLVGKSGLIIPVLGVAFRSRSHVDLCSFFHRAVPSAGCRSQPPIWFETLVWSRGWFGFCPSLLSICIRAQPQRVVGDDQRFLSTCVKSARLFVRIQIAVELPYHLHSQTRSQSMDLFFIFRARIWFLLRSFNDQRQTGFITSRTRS